jgi:hypothetical protein
VYGKRAFGVIGIVLDEPLEEATPPDANDVHTSRAPKASAGFKPCVSPIVGPAEMSTG